MKIVIVVVVCVLCLGESHFVGGKRIARPRKLLDSYFLSRLQLTDKTLLGLLRRVEAQENAKPNKCGVKGWRVLFDFEQGRAGWTLTGTAFTNQPTYGDNPTARKREQHSNHHGNWWIGGAENRPSPFAKAGAIQGDEPIGSMTSPPFEIRGSMTRFLIGGGCDINTERVELLIDGKVVTKATGKCTETMATRYWDVSSYVGKRAQLRLVDSESGGWGHINFDHFEMYCS